MSAPTTTPALTAGADAPIPTVPRRGPFAQCPECGSPALDRENLTLVSCRHCGEWSRI